MMQLKKNFLIMILGKIIKEVSNKILDIWKLIIIE